MIFVSPFKGSKQWILPDASGNGVKYLTEESIINSINEKSLLIPLEIELTEKITIDDSWGSWSIFEKYKNITFFANCSYSIDLSQISSENLKINSNTREVNLAISKPSIYSISINHDKTVYEEAQTGLLRFGDINLTAEEYGIIEREIKKKITDKMTSEELATQAKLASDKALDGLFVSILGENLETTYSYE